MLSLLLLLTVTAVAVAACGVLYAVAARPLFQPAVAGPFAPGSADPSADTLTGQAHTNTVFADSDWQSATLDRLCDVEDLLDYLEANRVTDREFHALGDNTFCVRWK